MLEHIIKQFLFEQAKFRWGIIPPTPALLTAAKEAGGVYAFTAKLNFTKKSVIPSDRIIRNILTSNISDMPSTGVDSVGSTGKYSNGNYIYLISNPLKESPNRLKFNVWIIERQKLKDMSVEVVDREKMTGYFTKSTSTIDFGERQIGNSDLMSYNDMARWFSALTEAATKQGVKLNLPDIQKINTIQSNVNTGEFKTRTIDITSENNLDYGGGSFRGKAEVSYTPAGDMIVTPLSGTTYTLELRDNEPHNGKFVGEFKNGVPYDGEFTRYRLGSSTDILSIWKGKMIGSAFTDDMGERNYSVEPQDTPKGKYGEYSVDNDEYLDYPYTAKTPEVSGYSRIYYLEDNTVYFVNERNNPPIWYKVPVDDFEKWIHRGTEITSGAEASPAEISILNKKYPDALSTTIEWKTNKLNTPVKFKKQNFGHYITTDEETFTASTSAAPPPEKPQYWLAAVKAGYTKLVGSSKDPNKSYWVRTDTLEQ